MEDIQKLEQERIASLNRKVVKARWIYIAIYLCYGFSLSFLSRVLEYEAIYIEAKPVGQWIGAGFIISYNILFFIILKKADSLSVTRLKAISYLQVLCDLFFGVFMFHVTSGIEGPATNLIFLPIILSAILLRPIWVLIVGFGAVLGSGLVTLLDFKDLIPHVRLYVDSISPNILSNLIATSYAWMAEVTAVFAVVVYLALTSGVVRKAEKALKQRTIELTVEKDKINAIIENLYDGLIFLDLNNRVTLLNLEAESVLNIKKQDILGKKIEDLVKAPRVKILYDALEQEIKWTGQRHEMVIEDPLPRYFQIMVSPVASQKGKRIGTMISIHDTTREKELEQVKTKFVSIAAHQLRTPLSAIKWTLRLLLSNDAGKINDDQRKLLGQGYQSNERMINLVNDLLNVARIEEGRLLYDMEKVSLEKIIEKYIQEIDPLIQKKSIKIKFEKPEKPLPQIEADEEKLGLVVQNLIENAIKYTSKEGQVTIGLKSDKINVEFMIKDDGIGIPTDQQDQVFGKYFRGENATKSGVEGTGMGLFICKSIVEKHGGNIWFESKEGEGTTFWFVVPHKKEEQLEEEN